MKTLCMWFLTHTPFVLRERNKQGSGVGRRNSWVEWGKKKASMWHLRARGISKQNGKMEKAEEMRKAEVYMFIWNIQLEISCTQVESIVISGELQWLKILLFIGKESISICPLVPYSSYSQFRSSSCYSSSDCCVTDQSFYLSLR